MKLTSVKVEILLNGRPINANQFSLEFLKLLTFSGIALKLKIRWRIGSVNKEFNLIPGECAVERD